MHPLCVPLVTLILQLSPSINVPRTLRFRSAQQIQSFPADRITQSARSGAPAAPRAAPGGGAPAPGEAGEERGWHWRQVSAATRCSTGVQRAELRICKVPKAPAEQKELKPEQEVERMQSDGRRQRRPGEPQGERGAEHPVKTLHSSVKSQSATRHKSHQSNAQGIICIYFSKVLTSVDLFPFPDTFPATQTVNLSLQLPFCAK